MVELNSKLFNNAKDYLVGGVNSPLRAFNQIGIAPIFIKKAKGAKIYSEDGREFIDYCMSWGALILGHAHPEVVSAINNAAKNGTTFGAATKNETELAMLINSAIPSMEKIRFTNSGTEAVMGAMKLARAYTRKERFLRFSGSYHGWADYGFYTAQINDLKNTEALIKKHKKDIAAIIIEPVGANNGLTLPQDGFLKGLRRLSDRYGMLLIFDEVVTGFRLTFGGAQNVFGVKPDLTCLGKIIGGGLAIGAFGGRQDIMKLLAPEGNVYQAGTFSGNPIAMHAGLSALKILSKKDYNQPGKLTDSLVKGIKEIKNFGPMFSFKFKNKEAFSRFYRKMLRGRVYFAPSLFEANFVSFSHTKKDIEKTIYIMRRNSYAGKY